jgi:endo-1,4-beta-xylanase
MALVSGNMIRRLLFIGLLASAAWPQTLRETAQARGIHVGTASAAAFLREADYARVLAREYDQVEPENDLKFGPVHPRPDTFAWQRADALAGFAQSHGMRMRGHTLVWHNQNPDWLTKGSFTSQQLAEILKHHIDSVVGHFAGKIFGWDVVNEAFNAEGSLRSTLWLDQPGIGMSGTGYIEQALKWARAADPNATLFYNDYDNEAVNAKSNAIFAMVKDFRQRGVPIDGVGLQMHITPKTDLKTFEENLKRFGELGVIVEITELDVRVPVDASGVASDAQLAAQAATYGRVVASCVKSPACKAIQTWGFTDKHSWIPAFFKGTGAALPFDQAYRPKPAYGAIQKALEGK